MQLQLVPSVKKCKTFDFQKNLFCKVLPKNQALPRAEEFKLHRTSVKSDYPLNLSISLSGGKEINKDYLSKGD